MGIIRLVLALSVVVWHLPDRADGDTVLVDAGVAVTLFFVISGFYMAMVLNEQYSNVRDFYASRFFRLAPVYFVMLAIMVAWFAETNTPSVFTSSMGQRPLAHIGLIALNLAVVGQDFYQTIVGGLTWAGPSPAADYVATLFPRGFFNGDFILIGQAWSLGSEILFYAIAPFVVRSFPATLALLLASAAVRTIMIWSGASSEIWSYSFFPATECLFLLGCLGYQLYRRIRKAAAAPVIGGLIFVGMVAGTATSIGLEHGVFLIDRDTGYDSPVMWLIYLGFAAALPFVFAFSKNNRLDRWIGELSYPLYIVHGLVLGVAYSRLGLRTGALRSEIVALSLSVAAAAAMYLMVDRPVDHWRRRRFHRKDGIPPKAVATVRPRDGISQAQTG